MKRYALLEATKTQWIVALEIASGYTLLVGVAASFAIASWNKAWMGLGFGAGLILSFIMTLYAGYAFYNLVKCPACGGRLNRFKNGKRVPKKQAFKQLEAGNRCRHCGWGPTVGG
ncbi:hypothetical protein [Dyella ginsengisoli]|uniref:hypothetical protein n=1 Tax=Dyella ginsengisoli TaxID=363848 RepID=UPI0012FDAE53|nr:hypothetical protein [Dyella ginsengisoli]